MCGTRCAWRMGSLCGAYMVAAFVPLAVGVVRPGITGYPRAMLEDAVYGRAHRPFVKRQLVPLMVRGGAALVPDRVSESMSRTFAGSKLVQRLGWPPAYATEFVFAMVLMYAGMLAFLVVLCAFLHACLDLPAWLGHTFTLIVGLALPVTCTCTTSGSCSYSPRRWSAWSAVVGGCTTRRSFWHA